MKKRAIGKSGTNKNNKKIDAHRRKIDYLDKKLIKLLLKRIKRVEKIGIIKKTAQLPIENEQRENEIFKTIEKTVKERNLSEKIKEIYIAIFKVSKEIEKEVK